MHGVPSPGVQGGLFKWLDSFFLVKASVAKTAAVDWRLPKRLFVSRLCDRVARSARESACMLAKLQREEAILLLLSCAGNAREIVINLQVKA